MINNDKVVMEVRHSVDLISDEAKKIRIVTCHETAITMIYKLN